MNNFTKEYIELCKDKKIQELRPKLVDGDWYQSSSGEICLFIHTNLFNYYHLWLPTGDQLDEEIIKICKENKLQYYSCKWQGYADKWKAYADYLDTNGYTQNYMFSDVNPLIAKIKLLLALKEN